MSADTFQKADSLIHLAGLQGEGAVMAERARQLGERLAALDLDPHRRDVLDRAVRALTGRRAEGEPAFELRPHIIEELRLVSDEDLPRYLFYRYRYDVFPGTRQLDAFPPCVQVEPTSICNYRCVFCYQVDRNFTQGRHGHMGRMSLDTFRHVIDQLEGNVEAVTLASRGEPLLCPDIEQMLAYLQGKFLGLKVNTNAFHLDEAKAHALLQAEPNTVVFSADAADPELYARLRVNGKFDRVLENIRRFADIRRRHYPDSRTITRVSGVRFSDDQAFDSFQGFWSDLVDQVAFVAYNPWENSYDRPANDITTPCSDLWRRTFVWWDGRVNPCDVDYRSTLAVGNVLETPLSELWTGEAYQTLRQRHESGCRSTLSPCSGCTLV